MKKYKFTGRPTAMNRHVTVYGDSYQEMFEKLVELGEMHYDTIDSYLEREHGLSFWQVDDDGEEWYDQEGYYEAVGKLTDDDYFDIMDSDTGNMYYQEYYELIDGEYERV